MKRVVVASSSIVSVAYDEEEEMLQIEFWHRGIYRYHGVPKAVWRRLLEADSKGDFYNEHVRDSYPAEQAL